MLVVTLAAVLVMLVDPRAALAFSLPSMPSSLPASLAGVGISAAEGTAVVAGGVAIAPAAVVAAAAIAGAAAAYVVWNWAESHKVGYADAPIVPGGVDPGGTCGVAYGTTCSGGSFTTRWGGQFTVSGSGGLHMGPGNHGVIYVNVTGVDANVRKATLSCYSRLGTPQLDLSTLGLQTYYLQGECSPDSTNSAPDPARGAQLQQMNFTDADGYVYGSYRWPTTGVADGSGGAAPTGTIPITTTPQSRCSDGSVTDGAPVTYTGSQVGESLPPLWLTPCPAGSVRTGASFPTTAGGRTVTSPLSPWSPPVVPANLANCAPGGAAAPCVLTLTKTSPSGQVVNCTNTALCTTFTGTATPEADGSTYSCKWGPNVMPLSDCTVVPTKPVTGTPPATERCPVGDKSMVCAPASGVSSDPAPDGVSCAGSWSWNPVDWVVTPIKCGLRWAFVPSAGTMQAAQTKASDGWKATGLPAWGSAVGGVGTGLAGIGNNAGGCAGPHFSFTLKGHAYAFDPLDACSQPMQGAAVVLKLFATLAVLVGGARLCARPLLASFGMGGAA